MPAALLGQVQQHAAALDLDLAQGLLELRSAVAALRAEHVARHALGVHADEHVLDAVDLALDEGEMVLVVDLRAEPDRAELAMLGRQQHLGLALDQLLGAAPIARSDPRRSRASARASVQNSTRSGTRAIVPSSFMTSQITPAGVSPARRARSTDPSVWPARSSVPPGRARNGKTCPGCTMSRAPLPGSAATLIVRARSPAEMPVSMPSRASIEHRERRLVGRLVVGDHETQPELVAALGREREADQATTVRRHEIDGFGRDELGGHAQVALVLAVGRIADDHHLTTADGLYGLFDRAERRARRGRVRGIQGGSQSGVPWT